MAMRNMMNTITLITIRNTPQTIPLVMYQRILIIRRKQCSRNVNTASPMDCAVCLMFIAAVILHLSSSTILSYNILRSAVLSIALYSLHCPY